MYNQNFYYPPVSPMGYASGGNVASQQRYGLAAAAEQLRQRGRGGDTILAHINPEEAKILKALGGSGTINPRTGLPEYKISLKNLNPVKIVKDVAKSAEKAVVRPVVNEVKKLGSQIDDVVNSAIPGGWGTVAAVTAAAMGMPSMGFAPEAAAAGGGAAELASVGATGAGLTAPIAAAEAAGAGMAGLGALDVAPIAGSAAGTTTVTPIAGSALTPAATVGTGAAGAGLSGYDLSYSIPGASPATSIAAPVSEGIGIATGAATPSTASSIANLAGAVGETALGGITSLGSKVIDSAMKDPLKAALYGTMAYGTVSAAQETKAQREAAERELARQAAKRAEDISKAESIMASNPPRYRRLTAADVQKYGIGMPRNLMPPIARAAGGGRINDGSFDDELGYDYARGGIADLPPRYLNGGGDGMSDSIPARIGNQQPARLSDSEFVIPADVVSHLGNGSSNAGAKKLYAMMDRVRKARTGKNKQAPAIKAERYMPA